MKTKLDIGIIDSGAGGLSILNEILSRRLSCNLHYISDAEKFPYGLLDESELCSRVIDIVDALLSRQALDACVIACNSASTLVLPHLRQRWNIPFVGVVPAIKPAAERSVTGVVGVLATPGTVSRKYLDVLIKDFAREKTVYKFGSNLLVALAENYILTGQLNDSIVEDELFKLLNQDEKMDTIVLACTHFPLVKSVIEKKIEGRSIQLLDSTSAIVNRLENLLPSLRSHKDANSPNKFSANCTLLNTIEEKSSNYSTFLMQANQNIEIYIASDHLCLPESK